MPTDRETTAMSIRSELGETDSEKLRELAARTEGLMRGSGASGNAAVLLADAEGIATPPVRRILEAVSKKHAEFNAMVGCAFEAMRSRSESERRKAYGDYLVQVWYHAKFIPEFERRFAERLEEYVASNPSRSAIGGKFLRTLSRDANEELAQELWALQDLEKLGTSDSIDLRREVFPETRALVRTQFDRLDRLNFKGFLGYFFYLESWVARHSASQLELMESAGIPKEAMSFLRNHRLVDQGHAADDVELLNLLIEEDADVEDAIDNLDVSYCLYSRMFAKCFLAP